MNRLRKVLTTSVMVMTIFAMVGIVAPASAATNGDLLKISSSSTVFYYNDGVIYPFPNEKTYFTWYGDWSGVKTVTMSELDTYTRGGNVTARAGVKLITTPTTVMVYAVEPGAALRSIVSEENAIALWGANWAQSVIDVPDSFFGNYTVGSPLTVGSYPIGTVVNTTGTMDIYYYDGTNYRKFDSEAVFLNNNYSFDAIVTVDDAVTAGGTAITGAEADLTTVAGGAFTPSAPGTGGSGLTVALAADTPASVVLPDGAMGVVMTKFNLTASSDGDVTIQNLSTYRSGIGTPSNISKVYLYQGGSSLSSTGKTVNSTTNKSIFTNLNYVIPAGTTKTIDIVAEIAASATDNHALGILEAADITTNGATVSGAFPVLGNTMSVANVNLGTATVTRAGSATYTRKIGEKEQIVAKFTVTTTYEDSNLNRLSVYNSQSDILNNMTLWRGGEKLATSVENGRYFDFVLDTPNRILKGEAITYTLKADVYSDNVSDYAYLYLKNNSDLIIIGETYGFGVTTVITGYDASSASEYTKIQLEAGDITMVSSGPSATDIAVDSNDITLMSLSITALNAARIEAFGFDLATSGTIATDFENVEFYCDGIGLISSTGTAATSHTWTDEFDLAAGTTYECLLRVDSTTTPSDGDTIYATLDITDWSFRDVNTDTAYASTSTSYNVVPTADQTGYTMTMRTAGLTVAAATSPASQTWVRGKQDVPFAGYTFTAGNADDVLIQDITITSCEDTGATALACGSHADNGAASTILAVNLYDGDTKIGTSKSLDSSGQAAFTDLNWTIPAGSTKTLTVKANLNTSLPSATAVYLTLGLEDGAITSYYDSGNKTISGTDPAADINTVASGSTSFNASTTASAYQYVINNGTLAMDIPGTTPATDIAIAGTAGVKFSEVKLTATREDFNISKMAFRNIASGYDDNIAKVYVKYPTNATGTTTETKECTLAAATVTCSGLAMWVPNPDIAGNKKYAVIEFLADMATKAAGADAADAPEFIPTLGSDWEAIGLNSGSKLYEQTITITDVAGLTAVDAGTATVAGAAFVAATTAITIDNGSGAASDADTKIAVGDIITTTGTTASTEQMFVTAVTTVLLTVIRGVNGTTAADATVEDNDTVNVYGTANTAAEIMTDVNPMNVQGTKLTVANQMATKTGAQSTTEKVMEFTVTADALGDATMRKGDQNDCDATADTFYTTGLAGVWAIIGANDGISAVTTTEAQGDGFLRNTNDGTAAIGGIDYDFTAATVDLTAYTGVSFWIRSSAATTATPADNTPSYIFTTEVGGVGTNANTVSITTADMWQLVEADFATAVTAVTALQVESSHKIAIAATVDIDNFILYKEKITVDLTTNVASTARDGGTAYLKQNGNIVAVGNVTWQDASTAAHTGAVVFIPYNTYNDIDISGTDTFTVEINTTNFVNSVNIENIIAAMTLGNSAVTPSAGSTNNFYWYDNEFSDNVPYIGVNTTDEISTSLTY
ncbi:MAG: hypothetical protein ABIG10_03440 [bacterium]